MKWTMASASKCVGETNRPASTHVKKPAMARSHVPHARCPVRFSACIQSVRNGAQSRVPHAQKRRVSHRVRIASVPCRVQHPVTIYLARSAVNNYFHADIDARLCVEKSVLPAPSVSNVPAQRSKQMKLISSWLRGMRKSTWTRTRVSSRGVAISSQSRAWTD